MPPSLIAVVASRPGTLREWLGEIFRTEDVSDLSSDPWYVYLALFLYVAPWVPWVIAGTFNATARLFCLAPARGATVPPARRLPNSPR